MNVHPNGVNGVTGQYLDPPQTTNELAAKILPPSGRSLTSKAEKLARGVLDLPFDVDPLKPERAGWAIVVHEREAAMLRDALLPLFAHRHGTLGERVQILKYGGESRGQWLASHGVADDDINPKKVPYYLLLAGSTESFPFEFAHDLAVDYAVGRLELESRAEYREYAERVVEYETGAVPKAVARRVAFFGPQHEGDGATQLSAEHLLTPLSDTGNEESILRRTNFGATRAIGATATKQRLADILAEADGARPCVLFTASHGVGFPADHPLQRAGQGALLCQDWPGAGAIDGKSYFAGYDVPADANVAGLIAFHFACFSAGTPEHDRFYRQTGGAPEVLTTKPFIGALAKELLRRGALAVAGHVDRAWGYSIMSQHGFEQLQSFENFLGRVLTGQPVAHAMRDFAHKYARHSVSLTNLLDGKGRVKIDDDALVELWTQRNDAGAYLVVGDPLVRLRLDAIAKDGVDG